MKKINTILISVFFLFIISAPIASAATFPTLIPEECTGDQMVAQGEQIPCNLSSVELMLTNVAQMILGITGSLALLMFVIGGIRYIIAGGIANQVSKAQETIKFAALGLGLVLFAGVLIKFLLKSLTGV